MHRQRTRFAARVNRIAKTLERRGIVATYLVHDRYLGNRSARRKLTHAAPELDGVQLELLERLREESYAVLPFERLFPDPATWATLEQSAESFMSETAEGLAREQGGEESALRRRSGKEFVVRKYSYGLELGLDDPWLALGASHRLLDLANAYLGMWSKLEYVDLWYTPPVADAARQSSQRWHRDFNDRHLLKAFIYLVDVDEGTGPFEYVPRSAAGGKLDEFWPWHPMGDNYPPDDLTAKIADTAVTFTAPKGTLILCNTSGFHRGGFATERPRVLATLTYSSPASLASLTERSYSFVGGTNGLDPATRFALT